jgi:hypothetical protein
MKLHPKKNSGSVMFLTLLTTGIICVYLGGYLTLVRNENLITSRSESWNAAIPVAEAGVEEAMSQLKSTFPDLVPVNGWKFNGSYLIKDHWINDREHYIVGIFPPEKKGGTPTIVSEGFVRAPLSETNYISRTIRVNTKLNGVFMPGLVVVKTVSMNGITTIDSFDSTTNTLSTGGKYDPKKADDKGYLATLSSGENLDLVTVYGSIGSGETAPGNSPSVKNSVGDKNWVKNNSGIQPGHYESDINVNVEYPTPPFLSANIPPLTGSKKSAAYILGTPGSTAPSQYSISDLSGIVEIAGNTQLLVTKSFNVSSLTIDPGATLELYVAAPSVDLSGNGQLNVQGTALNFKYFGLAANPDLGWPGNQTFDAGGNGEFTALIDAPGTDLILHGGGKSESDFSGAGLVKSVTFKGHYSFHYDEGARNALAKGYIAISWDEINLSWSEIFNKGLSVAKLY